MYEIEKLDENEIRQYPELQSGIGQKVHDAMTTYNARLIDIKCNDFRVNDQSSMHAVINELSNQMKNIADLMDDVDFMIDNVFHIINSAILEEEEKRANALAEG